MLRSFAWALPTPHPFCTHSAPPARRSALAQPCLPCAQTHVQADADAHREMAKRLEAKLSNARALVLPGGGDHSTAALAERVQRLTARLQGEQEQMRHQKHENARLQDECSVMREALEARGEVGLLQRAVVQARADSMRLALQLHDAKEGRAA